MTKTAVSTPRWSSVRATTKPSPPLLPRPHRTADAPVELRLVRRFDRRDDLAAGVFHQHERRDADVFDGVAVGLAHLRGGENAHHRSARAESSLQIRSQRPAALRLREVYYRGYVAMLMAATVNVNGRITSERDAVISVFDHGFLYGEGVYETLRTYQRAPVSVRPAHAAAAPLGADDRCSTLPFTDDDLAAQIRETMAAAAPGRRRGVHPRAGDARRRRAHLRSRRPRRRRRSSSSSSRRSIRRRTPTSDGVARRRSSTSSAIIPDSVNPMIKSNNLMNNALADAGGDPRAARSKA